MSKLVGTKPYQTPRNADLGTLAYQDADSARVGNIRADSIAIGTSEIPSFASVDGYGQHGIEIVGRKEDDTSPVIRLRETGSNYGAFEIRSNRSGILSGNILTISEGSDNFITIRADDDTGGTATRGFVGIGTDSPQENLHIVGDVLVDSGGSGSTAIIKFVNDNERSRITSNYDSGGGGRLGFWTDTAGGSLIQRMYLDNSGNKFNNGVREYSQNIQGLRNDTAYSFDVPIEATGSGYTMYYEVMYNHFGQTSYGSWRSGFFSFRSLSNSTYYDDVIHSGGNTGNAGAWTVTGHDFGTSSPFIRFSKSAGTYGGTGDGHIFVRGGLE